MMEFEKGKFYSILWNKESDKRRHKYYVARFREFRHASYWFDIIMRDGFRTILGFDKQELKAFVFGPLGDHQKSYLAKYIVNETYPFGRLEDK
jgi:hypothetical protein